MTGRASIQPARPMRPLIQVSAHVCAIEANPIQRSQKSSRNSPAVVFTKEISPRSLADSLIVLANIQTDTQNLAVCI